MSIGSILHSEVKEIHYFPVHEKTVTIERGGNVWSVYLLHFYLVAVSRLFLAPDIGMLGYIFGPGLGAFTYNMFYHKGIVVIILCVGWFFGFG